MRILVVEDEPTLAAQLATTLQAAGYAVDTAANGRDAGYMGEVETFDAVVLDLGLPMVDGLTVLKRWRALGRTMPVLILTARGDWHEKVAGIDAGADDYLTKPFSPRELLARINAVLRRRAPQMTDDAVEVEGLRLDPTTHRVFTDGKPVDLGPTEFRLLHFFMTHAERVHSRTQLLDQVWGDHVFVEERTVDVHIRRLRSSLEASGHDRLIQTVRGAGYRFSALTE